MEKNLKRLILLLSLILVAVPMVIFPNRLGMALISGSAIFIIYEFVYYGAVLYLFRRDTTLAALVVGSALTLFYRMLLGATFGLILIVMYKLSSSVAFSVGMTKYLPAVILHVIAAPFVMRPAYLGLTANMVSSREGNRRQHEPATSSAPSEQETAVPLPTGRTPAKPARGIQARLETTIGPTSGQTDEDNQFERAVSYLGESAVVKMCLLVDEEGLVLARFSRCEEDAELWAPLALVMERDSRYMFDRFGLTEEVEKIDICTKNMRIIQRRIEHVLLIILTERNVDEIIHIRVAQAADMIRKYMSERYSPALFARVEERYVSNT